MPEYRPVPPGADPAAADPATDRTRTTDLDSPTIDRSSPEGTDRTAETLSATGPTDRSTHEPTAPSGYAVLEELGGGGMGVVYKAVQHGLNRTVALKTLRPGVTPDSKGLIRFLAEAEVVGGLRHPNVVEVYSFGEHGGRPFLVLEYCPGGDLTSLTKAEAIRNADWFRRVAALLATIADGVQAAHASGIVHRDLKPHNVLLAADGTPKVTDFGLAKRGLGLDITRTDAVMGTPAYMSPEQAGGGTKFVGPEADVWALGVILYELLCGLRPFDAPSPLEVVTQVLGSEIRPVRSVCPAVPQDLAMVVGKCLCRDPRDRYHTAGELASDLRNWLSGKPILARPAGAVESAVKWASRNPRAAIGVTAVAVVLVAATWVSTWQALRATREASRASREAERADAEAAEARRQQQEALRNAAAAAEAKRLADEESARAKVSQEMSAFMRDVFIATDPTGLTGTGLLPAGQGGGKVTAAQLLDRGAKLIRRERFRGTDRNTRLTRAAMLAALGDVYRSIGRLDQAEPLLREAYGIREELLPADHPDRIASEFHLANWHGERGDIPDADRLYTHILETLDRTGQSGSLFAADVQLHFAVLLSSIDDDRSESLARAGLATRLRLLADDHRDVAVGRLVLAANLLAHSRYGEAMAEIKPALGVLQEKGLASDPTVAAVVEYQAGLILRNAGFPQMAVPKFRSASEVVGRSLGDSHAFRVLFHADLAICLKQVDPAAAEQAFRETVAMARQSIGIEHPQVVVLLDEYADLLVDSGKGEEAWAIADELLCCSEGRYGREVPWRLQLLCFAGEYAVRTKRHAVAIALADEALELFRTPEVASRQANVTRFSILAQWLDELPDSQPCRLCFKALFEHPSHKTSAERRWYNLGHYAASLVRFHKYDEAETLLEEAVALSDDPEVIKAADYGHHANIHLQLGKVAWAAGRFDDARTAFEKAATFQRLRGGVGHPQNPLSAWVALASTQNDTDSMRSALQQIDDSPTLDAVDRAWCLCFRAEVDTTGREELVKRAEKLLGSSVDADVVMYRARIAVAAGGDVAREAKRIDAAIKSGKGYDGVLTAKAGCALALGKPDEAKKALSSIKSGRGVTPGAHLRRLLTAVAEYRLSVTDKTLTGLQSELDNAERYFADAKAWRDPELRPYEAVNLIELRRWCRQLSNELQPKDK